MDDDDAVFDLEGLVCALPDNSAAFFLAQAAADADNDLRSFIISYIFM